MSRNRHHSLGPPIIVHTPRIPIPPEDITVIDGIRVTKPARTLLDLASVEPAAVIEVALDDALRRRLVTLPFLDRWLDDATRRRHPGARVLRRMVEVRATVGVTESPLETRLLQLIREAGLPIPMLQFEIRDGAQFVGRVDLAYPEARVAIEADGFRHHDTRQTFDSERVRLNHIQACGWRVLHVTAKHLQEEPERVVTWIRATLER